MSDKGPMDFSPMDASPMDVVSERALHIAHKRPELAFWQPPNPTGGRHE